MVAAFRENEEAHAFHAQHPLHAEVHAYWLAAGRPGALPARSDIDPGQLSRALPWIILYDVVGDGGDVSFRFRLIGTGIVERYGRDATGKLFEDVYEPEILVRQLAFFRGVVNRGRSAYSYGMLPVPDRRHVNYHRLVLPLADDGVNVDMLLAVMAFDDDETRVPWSL